MKSASAKDVVFIPEGIVVDAVNSVPESILVSSPVVSQITSTCA